MDIGHSKCEDFLLVELHSQVLGDTFQFLQILTDREQLQSLRSRHQNQFCAHSKHAAHKHARQSSFPEHTHARQAAAFHARWRNPKTGDFLKREELTLGLRGNLTGSLMSQSYENPPGIMCKIGRRCDERGLCRGETGRGC